ncbi:MAG TPA: FCD domain-containing protein [Solirubrobacter sp.]|nr:FCD domain-containing protein [Solirubrobacter sp.]
MTRLHEEVARSLIDDIVNGGYAPGDWLPREVDLAQRFGISRGVAREVIHSLRLRGVIDVRHGRGAWILPEADWNLLDAEVLRAAALAPAQRALLDEVLECRETLEADAAELAALRARPDERAALVEALDELEAALTSRRASATELRITAEAQFHDRLVACARNRPLRRMLAPVHLALASARHVLVPGELTSTARQHQQMARAVEDGDGAAARTAVQLHARELARWFARSADGG